MRPTTENKLEAADSAPGTGLRLDLSLHGTSYHLQVTAIRSRVPAATVGSEISSRPTVDGGCAAEHDPDGDRLVPGFIGASWICIMD
jgi:hypothetical protein